MEGNGIKLADDIINIGIELGASDIHLEPTEEDLKIRMRIDGILREIDRVSTSRAALISRIKIMSGLDIAERRVPQDGRSEILHQGRKIDLRVASLPTIFGEKIVIRILDKGKQMLDVKSLDFAEKNLQQYEKLYKAPHGIVLLTGPTGSGKSTTLYATLSVLNSEEKNIITIEDPVEYQLQGINQVTVNIKTGLTFAKGLRSIVRQDPDIIMVGEIRDHETADVAVQAALTGHLIFSTLHTNTAVGAVTRLLDMGVERYQLSSALRGSVGQRLVRKLCNNCKQLRPAKTYETAYLGLAQEVNLYESKGCALCGNTGYKGRLAVQEVFIFDDEMIEAFSKGCSEKDLSRLAASKGMTSMRDDGVGKVLQGLTTVNELLRVGV
ncbi:MAG: GspE/PulE family protein [Phascolarctobacterium sp.]|nr:GspE/PulE family protein [Phascolarctobacterium sp.]